MRTFIMWKLLLKSEPLEWHEIFATIIRLVTPVLVWAITNKKEASA